MSFAKHRIYLDYASAPGVCPEAIAAMRKAERLVGNPGAIHAEGVAAKKSLEDSRARIAALLGCKAREIVFTSGLTEANNLAILGYARMLQMRPPRTVLGISKGRSSVDSLQGTHWIVSSIEHDSVLQSFAEVERMGGKVTHIHPDDMGIIASEKIARALRPETVLVSIGWANNEIGVIQPLSRIARVLRDHEKKHSVRIALHSDAGQAPLYLSTVISSLGVDLLSFGGNKLYGPYGVGALYISKRTTIGRILAGGSQERGLRAGTENVALAAGFAAAYEKVAKVRAKESKRLKALRDDLAHRLMKIPRLAISGDLREALPHMLNVSIPPYDWRTSEYLALALDAAGIAVSTKSACREGEESRSHVVDALGGEQWRAQNSLRFSLGRGTIPADIVRCADVLRNILGY